MYASLVSAAYDCDQTLCLHILGMAVYDGLMAPTAV